MLVRCEKSDDDTVIITLKELSCGVISKGLESSDASEITELKQQVEDLHFNQIQEARETDELRHAIACGWGEGGEKLREARDERDANYAKFAVAEHKLEACRKQLDYQDSINEAQEVALRITGSDLAEAEKRIEGGKMVAGSLRAKAEVMTSRVAKLLKQVELRCTTEFHGKCCEILSGEVD